VSRIAARRIIAWLVVIPWTVWAVVRVLGAERGYPFVQLIAYTPYVLPIAVGGGVVAALLRRWAPAGLAAATAIALAVVLAPRATGHGAEARAGGPQLRVLTANTLHGSVPPEALVDLVRRERVDVLAIQELTPALVDGLERAGIGRLLPHDDLGTDAGIYSRVRLRPLPALVRALPAMAAAELDVRGAPPVRFVSVHVIAPLHRADIPGWRSDLRALPDAPASGPIQLLAGDFNATLDHHELRRLVDQGYRDAAEATGAGLKPTWRGNRAPPVTIDHVLVPERCSALDVAVHELPRSDHRAVLATIALPAR
jgi:endonuclease/exonuclease/phosphatase family metal-dependent hydrolase